MTTEGESQAAKAALNTTMQVTAEALNLAPLIKDYLPDQTIVVNTDSKATYYVRVQGVDRISIAEYVAPESAVSFPTAAGSVTVFVYNAADHDMPLVSNVYDSHGKIMIVMGSPNPKLVQAKQD